MWFFMLLFRSEESPHERLVLLCQSGVLFRESLQRFLQMLLNGGELDGKRYLKRETVALMTSDQIGPETGSRCNWIGHWRSCDGVAGAEAAALPAAAAGAATPTAGAADAG